ncbi:acyl-CoA-binding domain-containing protein 5 [Anoplophora glabripennis]|uniref:Acyl-CoA-binding domain-containing protein n=1 Tax=Anoplophora glabripennis TaxID=217634 RepID=V5H4I4_ANOGL|nr:acyl-CoA-binding domain-containing protein 5 [Anoplophora glabripennis]
MTTEEKFNAAVNVIRSLPKNGSYQPSNDLMLRFYGYFKQATLGSCTGSRPAFWDVVGRAKYDAWKKLGDMSKEAAMAKYVEELHGIVETMSYSDKVANFLEAPTNELDTINMDDLELIAGDVMERVRSLPNSPLASREASPVRFGSNAGSSASPSPSTQEDESDHSDDEYIDTIENPEPRKYISSNISTNELPNGNVLHIQSQHISRSRTKPQNNIDISQEISRAVQNMKEDIEKLKTKVNFIENANRSAKLQRRKWFLGETSPQVFVFLLIWPFIANFIMNRFLIRRN